MKPKFTINLLKGETIYSSFPELKKLAEKRVGNKREPAWWVEPAREVLGASAEALLVCGSREEAWLATAIAKELGPFDQLIVSKPLKGDELDSWATRLIGTTQSGNIHIDFQWPILPFSRLNGSKHRGKTPTPDIRVRVVPRFPQWDRATKSLNLDSKSSSRSLLKYGKIVSLAIEYDGGAHQRDSDKDKIRDFDIFNATGGTPTLRVSGGTIKKSGGWEQFRPYALSVRSWVHNYIDSSRSIDSGIAAIFGQYEALNTELVSLKALASHARNMIKSGDNEGAIAVLNHVAGSGEETFFSSEDEVYSCLARYKRRLSGAASREATTASLRVEPIQHPV